MLLGMPHKYTGGIDDENMFLALYRANSGSIFRKRWFNFTQRRLIRYAIFTEEAELSKKRYIQKIDIIGSALFFFPP